jgi:hypothetical protein
MEVAVNCKYWNGIACTHPHAPQPFKSECIGSKDCGDYKAKKVA